MNDWILETEGLTKEFRVLTFRRGVVGELANILKKPL